MPLKDTENSSAVLEEINNQSDEKIVDNLAQSLSNHALDLASSQLVEELKPEEIDKINQKIVSSSQSFGNMAPKSETASSVAKISQNNKNKNTDTENSKIVTPKIVSSPNNNNNKTDQKAAIAEHQLKDKNSSVFKVPKSKSMNIARSQSVKSKKEGGTASSGLRAWWKGSSQSQNI